ncbi:MAG: ABC transporter substrate-binding protein [Nitrospirota bacterium]
MRKFKAKHFRFALIIVLGTVLFGGMPSMAFAETKGIRIAQQYSIGYIPLMMMEKNKLLEKNLKAAGLGDVKVTWNKFAGGNVMNEALLSGNLDFAAGGLSPAIRLWDKTRGRLEVKLVAAVFAMSEYLVTRNPNVKTVKDFTDKDRIALPAVKVSDQATYLQMAAVKAFGENNYSKLDHLTISMSHPDAMTSMLAGTEINSHFGVPPYQNQEMDTPGAHTVLTSYEVMGGPVSATVYWATSKFRDNNPKTYAVFIATLKEAIDIVNKDKRTAAEFYVNYTKSKLSVDRIYEIMRRSDFEYATTPRNTMKMAEFLHKINAIKVKPDSWEDLFFPEVHKLPGS